MADKKNGFYFEESTHSYFLDGKRMTGITTIIGVLAKPALINWAARTAVEYVTSNAKFFENYDRAGEAGERYIVDDVILEEAKSAHNKKKEDAAQKGTDAHALVEEYVNRCLTEGGKPILAYNADDPIAKFMKWSEENVDRFLFSERRMHDPELFIAGTADFAYVGKDGKTYMADFKTSSGIYGIDYWLQVAAYKMLAESEGDETYDGMCVVRMGKDDSFEVQNLYEYETYREAFLSCLNLYRAQASIKDLTVKQ